jgi:hypothetical protein
MPYLASSRGIDLVFGFSNQGNKIMPKDQLRLLLAASLVGHCGFKINTQGALSPDSVRNATRQALELADVLLEEHQVQFEATKQPLPDEAA